MTDDIKVFTIMELDEAYACAAAGGQALHLHNIVFDRSPQCFRSAVEGRGEWIAHLFDQNTWRLMELAKRCGIKVLYIDKRGTHRQHVDFCGVALQKLLAKLTLEERAKVPPNPGVE